MGLMLYFAMFVSLVIGVILGAPAILWIEMAIRRDQALSRPLFWLSPLPPIGLVVIAMIYEFEYHIEDQTDGLMTAFRDAVVLGLSPGVGLYFGLLVALLFSRKQKRI